MIFFLIFQCLRYVIYLYVPYFHKYLRYWPHCTFFSLFYRSVHDQPPQPTILFKSNRHHRGSIYCIAWSATGDIIATGSNDKSIKMMKFDVETCSVTWPGLELAIHSGTVRDLAFVSRASGTPVLVSGGAGTDEDSIREIYYT